MNFDMNAAWERAVELIKDNVQLLAIIAAVFLLLPSIAINLFMPNMAAISEPGGDPEVVWAQLQANIGPIIIAGVLGSIVQFAGYGAMIALMGRTRPTVGEAIATGFKITPTIIAVFLLYFLLYFLGAVLVVLPLVLIIGFSGAGEGAGAIAGALGVIPIMLVAIYIAARMSMSMAVVVLEGTLNPITATLRSFKLTHKRQWSILIFWVVLFALYFVIALLFSGGVGAIAALAGGGTMTALILGITNGLMGMASGMIISALAVAIFQQLSGPDAGEVSSVFE
ncbi:MAG: hypothetical protein AAF559_10560 [Pseudomonadota bacterium]